MSKNYKLKFGKYKYKKLTDIPFDYLKWLLNQDFCPKPVKEYMKDNKDEASCIFRLTEEDKKLKDQKHPYYYGIFKKVNKKI